MLRTTKTKRYACTIPRIIGIIAITTITGIITLSGVSGCTSGTAKISESSNKINHYAQLAKEAARRILSLSENRQITNEAETIIKYQDDIQNETQEINTNLTKVQDKPSRFSELAGMLRWVAIAATIFGVIFILIYTGAATPIRILIGTLSRKMHRRAQRMLKTEQGRMSIKETIAAERAQDTAFDTAYKQEKVKQQKQASKQASKQER